MQIFNFYADVTKWKEPINSIFSTVGVIIGIDLLGLYPPFRGEGLLVGVVAGLVIASIGILLGNFKNSYYFHKETYNPGDTIHMHLSEEVSFLNKASIRESLDHIPENSTIIIDASNTRYIDFDVLEIIKEFRDIKAPIKNIACTCTGFKESYLIENRYNIQSSH